ncbi:hypothetical protein B0H14DRAFT_3852427 [Mycena olivaceomarginata]|nr:hypothetical protein B0H14DRAFT_3852427 [Mycena olivaceomarginata]
MPSATINVTRTNPMISGGDEKLFQFPAIEREELLSNELFQLSSDLARPRRPFCSRTLTPHESSDFWALDVAQQARDMADFRGGLAASMEDAQTDALPHFEVEIVDHPLAEGPQQSELARFRQWSFQPHTPALRIHESHDFWDIAIIANARDMFHFREGLALAPKAEPDSGHDGSDDSHTALTRFRPRAPSPASSALLCDSFWNLKIIHEARDMSDFRRGLSLPPNEGWSIANSGSCRRSEASMSASRDKTTDWGGYSRFLPQSTSTPKRAVRSPRLIYANGAAI